MLVFTLEKYTIKMLEGYAYNTVALVRPQK